MKIDSRDQVILELGFRGPALPLLHSYLRLLWSSNAELNLVSRQMSVDDLLDNHVIDCLLPLRLFPKNLKKVADFGTGGGLPGIIYALQFPEIQFFLYEKSLRKREFLQKCCEIAPNIQVCAEIPSRLDGVDLVMARGFKPLAVILQMSLEHDRSGGRYFLLKGRREKIDEELREAGKRSRAPEIIPLKSPVLQVERHLVLV